MIIINIQNKGDITVYKDDEIILFMKRNTPIPFFKTIGEIYSDEKIAKITYGFLKKDILFQNFKSFIEIKNQKLFAAEFYIGNDIITVTKNPFVLFNRSFFCKIYSNLELIANVSLKKKLDTNGINLKVEYLKEDETIEYNSLICLLIYSIEFNLA
ncbi:MAG: hypothetical protein BGO88_05275 [Flavobacterium sp. 38-13]|uniref:hypothetical protein n=1 Tax=Flavobacterium sp. 38-13 TaxID=1896168 RepID=UPI000964118B|nr:hypothetical protein [Flavobacterium sp. 38-13]OJX53453.1 MAG: hypothetical protein BGO88_05275 [Flavobacterium sp. 38-13]